MSDIDTDSFIAYIKADDIYKDIVEDAETRFDTSNYELDRTLPKGKNEKLIGLMKDKLVGKMMVNFVGLRAKSWSYLIHGDSEEKKAKGIKKCVKKRKIKFQNYKNCLEATQLENKINYPEKNKIEIDSFFRYKRKQKKFIRKNKLVLKTQQRFKSERHNVFTEEIKKIALISNNDKRMQ